MVIAGFTIGFIQGWMFTLIICAILPFMMVGMSLFIYSMEKMQTVSKECYAVAGGISEEVLTGIRTVKGLCGEEFEY
jgi:ABC-type multidrug transport system fused ATPase/permease subunit